MDDDLDPGPALGRSPTSASVHSSVGNPPGRGLRFSSVQRQQNQLQNWRINRNDQPRGRPSNPRNTGQPRRELPQSRRGGRAGFNNLNARNLRPNTETQQQNHASANATEHHRRGNANSRNNADNNINRRKYIGFKRLEEIANCESQDALVKLMQSKDIFIELIQSPIEKFDMFVLILQCLAKVCRSSFDELKMSLLMDICNSNFIANLKSYLLELPYVQVKATNNMYWKNEDSFWENMIAFFECVITTAPTLALNKCRSLVEATSKACLDSLKERHTYALPIEYAKKLQELRERLADFEKKNKTEQTTKKQFKPEDGTPPENFRELSVMPTRDDLVRRRAFLRPNIVNGAYQDVEHYLDVQFRLLREDCFGPLRDGLSQYMEDPKRRKYDHIRVFADVKFVKPYVSQTKMGSLVQIDMATNRNFKRINWAHSKRFIYGSLVLFTKDNCKSFVVGTILDRDTKYLAQGLIPVSLMGEEFNERLYNEEESYTMIESEVYFEPYYHVLKALQDPSFPGHLAMKQYIVDVNPEPKHPSYLKNESEYSVVLKGERQLSLDDDNIDSDSDSESDPLQERLLELNSKLKGQEDDTKKFVVLSHETWPDKEELKFNESQYEAYKLALTHEFAVIQGPPGTGKTYLGIKVAKTLFQNLKKKGSCLMLVICYTNHALDQFLEALLKMTHSIARIGGQSRNEAMDKINLTRLRRNINTRSESHRMFIGQKIQLKEVVSDFQKAMVHLDVLLNGVMKSTLLNNIPEIELLNRFYRCEEKDSLFQWLFVDNENYYTNDDVNNLLLEEAAKKENYVDPEKEKMKRTGVQLDDQESNEAEQNAHRAAISCFSLEETNSSIKSLIVELKKCTDPIEQQHLYLRIRLLNSFRELFNDMSQHRNRRIRVEINGNTNFNRIAPVDRWTLYFMWIRRHTLEKKNEIGEIQARVTTATTAYEEARMLLDLQVLQNKKIVGMTTSGAARMRKLLQTLAPPIVIVEEAAEVLEQHIITSLTKDCKHLILIGDHQQLRPSASHIVLARHFQLEVSLFERMISNGIHSRRLGVQHRMRPEISALICPHIYDELQNHHTVYDFPDVKGMSNNLFFLTHNHKEDVVVESMSRTNQMEADLVLALANYLMQQGYYSEDVTILAAYKGQMFYMRKAVDKYIHLSGVKITVVDNYQGEESKIILLSLVRNNEENKIGFLGTANRICVALSRAKEGFYIFGNIDNLKANSELWRNIAATLEKGESVGTSVTLKCQNHPQNVTTVSKLEDFDQVPEGGCKSLCDFILRACGHKCQLFCHGYDREHSSNYTKCPRPCERILCELGHGCPKKCAEDCGPCKRKMQKTLPCGHQMKIDCYREPDDPEIKCFTLVDTTLPDCGHKAQKMCYLDTKDVRCTVKCEYRVDNCGHLCIRNCHVKDDPNHEKYVCTKQCAKAKKGCTAQLEGDRGAHQCPKKCHETCDDCNVQVLKRRSNCTHKEMAPCMKSVDEKPCMKKCARTLPTCEHFCKKKCSEECGDCMEMVIKQIPDCKHEIRMMCKVVPVRNLCNQKCNRTMSCGHKCKGICGEKCDPSKCNEPSSRKVASPCGHQVTLPCKIAALPADKIDEFMIAGSCKAACNVELACKHLCRGTCSQCHGGRLHAPCTQPCHQRNICEHQCEEPCNQICPPCKKPCEVRCKHSRCNQMCGAPCTPCQELCGRRCPHGICKQRCGETCARPACDQPCPRRLRCKHQCRGLCGEPCPPVCRHCDLDNFPTDFLGDQFDDDAKFILLQDCGHVMEIQNMDTLMWGDREAIEVRKCPFCRKPIINTDRYKDFVNKIFKDEINPIKRKIYGTEAEIKAKQTELTEDIAKFRARYLHVLQVNGSIKTVYLNLQSVAKTTKKVSKLQLDMESICLNVLDMIAECYSTYINDKLTELKEELEKHSKMLCQVFAFKVNSGVMLKVSEQQQIDMGFEIKRMNSIVQLAKLTGNATYQVAKSSPEVEAKYDAAKAAVFSWTVFDEKETMQSLKNLQTAMKDSSVVITKLEREMIVKAMTDLKAGQWFKCPNGHIYCIGECGGAMEESKCPECGARIGGQNHTLTAGNAHAPEMDGSRFPRWSEQYNNMANFDLQV